jgi:hypothetical protein
MCPEPPLSIIAMCACFRAKHADNPQPVRCVYLACRWVGALFAVRADFVRAHPRGLYTALLQELCGSPAPEAGHFMERCWRVLLCGGSARVSGTGDAAALRVRGNSGRQWISCATSDTHGHS